MSGVEVAGLILGALPLAVWAMERYRETKKTAGTFWKVRKAYDKDLRSVRYCLCLFSVHLEEILQPLAINDINGDANKCAELLKAPGGKLWKNAEVEKALAERLRNCYQPYMETLEELQKCMVQLLKETKFEDPQFQQLLEKDQSPNNTAQQQLMQKANAFVKDTGFQARRIKYSLTISAREEILREVTTYIKRLQELLAAVDRVSKTSQDRHLIRVAPVTSSLLHFWRHADRIYSLLRRSMSCNCRPMHCARLWLRQYTEAQVSLSLLLQFNEVDQSQASPWAREALKIRHVDDAIVRNGQKILASTPNIMIQAQTTSTASSHQACISAASVQQSDSSKISKVTSKSAAKVSFATPAGSSNPPPIPTPDLMAEGMCKALGKKTTTQICLGALVDNKDQVQYHVFPEPPADPGQLEIVRASEVLGGISRPTPPFYGTIRHSVALKLAAAQIQFHQTPWFKGTWTLSDIRFPKRPAWSGGLDYSNPYLSTGFEAGATGKAPVSGSDESFVSLGVVLLELCFGMLIEHHPRFTDSSFPRNPHDPFQRSSVAAEWAKDVELEADTDYAMAVNWCLHQSPVSNASGDWRKEFAQNVLQPLQRCCESARKVT